MSTIGNRVSGRTFRELLALGAETRAKLAHPLGRSADTFPHVFELHVCPTLGLELDVRRLEEMPEELAHFDVKERSIVVREDVMRNLRIDDPEARFTILHELAHAVAHGDPKLYRAETSPHLSAKIFDAEWQADILAVALAVDENTLQHINGPESLARYLKLPVQKCRSYWLELNHVPDDAAKENLAASMPVAALQTVFDFGANQLRSTGLSTLPLAAGNDDHATLDHRRRARWAPPNWTKVNQWTLDAEFMPFPFRDVVLPMVPGVFVLLLGEPLSAGYFIVHRVVYAGSGSNVLLATMAAQASPWFWERVPAGQLWITWAALEQRHLPRVERYLIDELRPMVCNMALDADPLALALPRQLLLPE